MTSSQSSQLTNENGTHVLGAQRMCSQNYIHQVAGASLVSRVPEHRSPLIPFPAGVSLRQRSAYSTPLLLCNGVFSPHAILGVV